MKNLILQIILIILIFSLNAFCQNFSVTIVKVKDVTCHGGSTGELRADPVNISGGVSPCIFQNLPTYGLMEGLQP